MKHAVISLAILMAACFTLNAQDFEYKKAARPDLNEISISYGTPTIAWVATTIALPIANILFIPAALLIPDGATALPTSSLSSGAVGLEYMRYINSGRVAFGGTLSYENLMLRHIDKNDSSKNRSNNVSLLTFMPSIKVVWFNYRKFGMYSRAAIGVSAAMTKEETVPYLALQISAVGMEFGGRHCRGFFETGDGTQGTFVAGIKACF